MLPNKNLELTSEEITSALEKRDYEALKTTLSEAHASDIAELLVSCPTEQIAEVIRMLRAPKGIEAFAYLNVEIQAEVVKHLGRAEIIKILEELSADDRAELLRKLPPGAVDSFLPLMAQAERDDVRKLLQYGEMTAGALMTTEYASLPPETTLAEAMVKLHNIAPDRETIYYTYVVDSARHLIGIVSLREIIVGRPSQKIQDILSDSPISVRVDTDQEEVARTLRKYDLLAVPVVDLENRLVGIVTHDDVMDVIVAEQTEDVHRLGAVEPLTQPYFQAKFWQLAWKRGFWLLLLFVEEFFTGSALRHYHDTLQQALALAFFVPLIISSGGNSGSQSATLITRALAVGDVRLHDILRVFWRETAMGIVLGTFLGFIGFLRALMWHSSLGISLSVGLTLVGVVTVGSLIGALLPLIFKKLGFDPAITSSPFVASLVDVVGIVIYFNIAQLLI